MKSDLDRIMAEQGIDALWVTGPTDHNPNMVYFTGIKNITSADLFILRNQPPVLFHQPMERDEALKSGLKTVNYSHYPFTDFLKKAEGDTLRAYALINQAILEDLHLTKAKVFISGKTDVGSAYAIIRETQKLMPTLEITSGFQDEPFKIARMTKDITEIERICRVGKLTVEVVGLAADFLSHQQIREDILVNNQGQAVTVGDVKTKLRLWLAERNLESPAEIVFSQGIDAAVPHSAGRVEDVIRIGIPIVFDIFPCEAGGGYYCDFTRTWCLGYAPDPVHKLHSQVLQVHHKIISELCINRPFTHFQTRACELFAQMGHATVDRQPETEQGYVHSLGHGVGLDVHEKPFSGLGASAVDSIQPGVVFTIEPGLYYPERGMGVRIEDTLFADQQGKFDVLTEYSYDLVIPIIKKP